MPCPNPSRSLRSRQLWAGRIEQFQRSGQSVATYCRSIGCSVASFYHWKRKLSQSNKPDSQPLPDSSSQLDRPIKLPPFLKIQTEQPQQATIQIRLERSDITILVPISAIESLPIIVNQLSASCSR